MVVILFFFEKSSLVRTEIRKLIESLDCPHVTLHDIFFALRQQKLLLTRLFRFLEILDKKDERRKDRSKNETRNSLMQESFAIWDWQNRFLHELNNNKTDELQFERLKRQADRSDLLSGIEKFPIFTLKIIKKIFRC